MSPNDNAFSSTAGTLLPPNWIEVFRRSPGQRVSAISNDAGTFLALNHRADRLMDTDWTKDLKPDEAQAALDSPRYAKSSAYGSRDCRITEAEAGLQAKAEGR